MGNQNTFALPSTLSTQNDHSLSPSIAHSFGQYNQHVQDHINKEKPYQQQLKSIQNSQFKVFKQNEFYQGTFDPEGRPKGFGKLIRKDGSMLLAHFEKGKANGQGRYIFSNGAYYQGQLQNSEARGQGRLVQDKLVYEGSFKDNSFDGEGQLKVGKQYVFKGMFEEGKKKEGQLKWYEGENSKNLCEYQGKFDGNEQFTGKGFLKNKYGYYEGDFMNGKKHGKGIYKFKIGLTYVGQYRQDMKEGEGILYNMEKINEEFTYAQKDELVSYKGEFKNGLPHGRGQVWNKEDNRFYESEWAQGIFKSRISE